jgi:hypothetical protein
MRVYIFAIVHLPVLGFRAAKSISIPTLPNSVESLGTELTNGLATRPKRISSKPTTLGILSESALDQQPVLDYY